jgi:hypothetical protein
MPVVFVATTLAWGQYSVAAWIMKTLSPGVISTTSEAVLVTFSAIMGTYLLLRGRERLVYSQDLELMLFREQRHAIEVMLPNLGENMAK